MSSRAPFLALDNQQTIFPSEAIKARRRLLARQEKLTINIIRWRKYTASVFGINSVVKNLLMNCIGPVASGWEVGGKVCIRRVLPNELATPQIKA